MCSPNFNVCGVAPWERIAKLIWIVCAKCVHARVCKGLSSLQSMLDHCRLHKLQIFAMILSRMQMMWQLARLLTEFDFVQYLEHIKCVVSNTCY